MGVAQQRDFVPPMENVVSKNGSHGRLIFGVSSLAAKQYNEDAYSIKLHENIAFLGVFDGHSGYEVSKYCKDHLFDFLISKYEMDEDFFKSDEKLKKGFDEFDLKMESYWKTVIDKKMKEMAKNHQKVSPLIAGSTASVAIVIQMKDHSEVVFLNLGDSLGSVSEMIYMNEVIPGAKLAGTRGCVKLLDLADEIPVVHSPKNGEEKRRILDAGGMFQNRGGSIYVTHPSPTCPKMVQMTRAFGDYELKWIEKTPRDQQILSAIPFVKRKIFKHRDFANLDSLSFHDMGMNPSTVDSMYGLYFMRVRSKILICLFSDGAARLTFDDRSSKLPTSCFERYVSSTLKDMVESNAFSLEEMMTVAEKSEKGLGFLKKLDRSEDSKKVYEGKLRSLNNVISYPKKLNLQGDRRNKMPNLSVISNNVIARNYVYGMNYCDDATAIIAVLDIAKVKKS